MREKLIELLNKVQDYGTKNTYEEHSITVESKNNKTVADHLIANGVTIPVRCKDCKWYTLKRNVAYNGHFCDKIIEFVKPDDFCSYGERRTDDG